MTPPLLRTPPNGAGQRRLAVRVGGHAILSSPMHEVAISEALLGQLVAMAGEHGWSRLSKVWVRVGLLSGVVPEALEFSFAALAAGTPAEGAELVMETEPGRFVCDACGELDLDRLVFACPQCGGPLRLLKAGRELMLSGVELMDSETNPDT